MENIFYAFKEEQQTYADSICHLSFLTIHTKIYSKSEEIYLHARIKSALWSRPTYLYSASASHTTSTNISRETTTVVRLLYISNGLLLFLSTSPATTKQLSFSTQVEPPTSLANSGSFPFSGEVLQDPSLLINSKTLRLICQQRQKSIKECKTGYL